MIFKKAVGAFAAGPKVKGYILLKDILSDEFLSYLNDFKKKPVT